MNKAQRIIVFVCLITIALVFFYVPYEARYIHNSGWWQQTEYYWIWSAEREDVVRRAKIDFRILSLEILGIITLSGAAFVIAGWFKRKIKEGEK